MGIGNTTTAAAVLAALTGLPADAVTGRGGGLTDEAFARKRQVVAAALRERRPDPTNIIHVLAQVGGLDLAAMCGAFIGSARCRLPAVIDGFVSAVAALCAVRLCPTVRDYLFPSHLSAETGMAAVNEALGLTPWLPLQMRLGEGSGCPLAFLIMEAACAAMNDMALFGEEAAIDDSYLAEIRAKDCF